MTKNYYVIEVNDKGDARLMVKTLLKQQAYSVIDDLKNRYPGRKFVVEIRGN